MKLAWPPSIKGLKQLEPFGLSQMRISSLLHKRIGMASRCKATINVVEIQDFSKIMHHFRVIYKIYLISIKKNGKLTTCDQVSDLETTQH
jgi:hypothetical protein